MNQPYCVRLTIHGRVQGVGYRAWLARNAGQRGLTGWVKNRHHGTVEALLCGDAGAVEEMIGECSEGPLAARVSHVDRLDIVTDEIPEKFRTLATD